MDSEPRAREDATQIFIPPYISFRTLLNLIEKMAVHGVPQRIDRSFLNHLSGGYQSQVMASLRALSLIDDEGHVGRRLVDLVSAPPEGRPPLIGDLVSETYPEAMRLASVNATQAQLEESFRGSGITGDTLRRAVTFFIHAATYAQLPVSPHFKTGRLAASSPGRPRKSRPRSTATPANAAPPLSAATNGTDALRERYIEMLLTKAEASENSELLDRIEGLLGFRDLQSRQKE